MASPVAMASALESHNPATGEVIACFEPTSPNELPAILARARRTQEAWAAQPLEKRCALLGRLREVLYQRRREIAELVTREVGKPLVESLFSDVLIALDAAGYYAHHRRTREMLAPEPVPHHNPAMKAKRGAVHYEPYGVLGIISPWNYPVAIPMGQIIPAIITGNAVVLKPSELTPWCGALVGELFGQAGFPPGLVQVAQGRGDLGAALVSAEGVDKIVFTGSVATGKRVAEACGKRLLPSVLELGGKDAMIVLADADLETASSGAVWGSFTNCGQACLSVERTYVEQGIVDKFTKLCVAKTRKLRVGNGLEADTEVGPMISEQQLGRVERQIAEAVAAGAKVLCGGRRSPLGPCFFEPTVISGADHSMRLMREETFGPVMVMHPVADAAEAVRLANDSEFGLSASVWTRNERKGREVAAQLRAGTVMINDALSAFGICEAPHGGRGASGWGRTHGRIGLREMLQVKYVDEDRLPRTPKAWWFGYDEKLNAAAERFVAFLFAPKMAQRWRQARGALGTVFRKGRI
jgi:succinate-semialdehyde dehydrogenase/glutarate-semialdehyde dehydrogenase